MLLHYKFICVNEAKHIEEDFFNGQFGTREIELKLDLVVTDFWNKQTLPSKKRPCAYLWKSPIVAWDGKVSVCCCDDDSPRTRLLPGMQQNLPKGSVL